MEGVALFTTRLIRCNEKDYNTGLRTRRVPSQTLVCVIIYLFECVYVCVYESHRFMPSCT